MATDINNHIKTQELFAQVRKVKHRNTLIIADVNKIREQVDRTLLAVTKTKNNMTKFLGEEESDEEQTTKRLKTPENLKQDSQEDIDENVFQRLSGNYYQNVSARKQHDDQSQQQQQQYMGKPPSNFRIRKGRFSNDQNSENNNQGVLKRQQNTIHSSMNSSAQNPVPKNGQKKGNNISTNSNNNNNLKNNSFVNSNEIESCILESNEDIEDVIQNRPIRGRSHGNMEHYKRNTNKNTIRTNSRSGAFKQLSSNDLNVMNNSDKKSYNQKFLQPPYSGGNNNASKNFTQKNNYMPSCQSAANISDKQREGGVKVNKFNCSLQENQYDQHYDIAKSYVNVQRQGQENNFEEISLISQTPNLNPLIKRFRERDNFMLMKRRSQSKKRKNQSWMFCDKNAGNNYINTLQQYKSSNTIARQIQPKKIM